MVIYQTKSGALELREDLEKETVWATQTQMAEAFDVTPQNITLHLKNIYKDRELEEKATCKESLQVQKEGKREVERDSDTKKKDQMVALVTTMFR